uniref:Trehalose 6-phosphate phosphatase n=1 Tax=Oryza rufipogon TaxID=4529 RepID=A0A0E0PH08_ORYRU
MNNGKTLDFVVCIGNDRSDEDTFKSIDSMTSSSAFPAVPEVFACSVGQKPSKAKYYVNNVGEVVRLLKNVAGISSHREAVSHGRDMFKSIDSMTSSSAFPAVPEVFACSVGQKPSKAKYYVDNAGEVVRLLKNVADISSHREAVSHGRVIFRDVIDYVD